MIFQAIYFPSEYSPFLRSLCDGGGEKNLEFDVLLIAAGRKPAVEGLGLEKAGVEFDLRKGLTVNERSQTTNSDIYGVGDVASKYQFTYMADFMPRLVIKNALFWGREKVSELLIPWAAYTRPGGGPCRPLRKGSVRTEYPFYSL